MGNDNIVAHTKEDPQKLANLIEAMTFFTWIGKLKLGRSQRFTQFSDCLVVSCLKTEKSAVFNLLNAVLLSNIETVKRGYLLRGAVTSGKLSHTDDLVVGPAMVRAYEMESELAEFPRVIVDRHVIKTGIEHHASHHGPEDELKYILSMLAIVLEKEVELEAHEESEAQGWWYLDYISLERVQNATGFSENVYLDYLRTVSGLLKVGLKHQSPKVVCKYEWLLEQYRRAIERALEPSETEYLKFQSFYDGLRKLPRFTKHVPADQADKKRDI